MPEKENIPTITEDEAALYDRQIRLWGLDAQRRLRGARVLLIGISGFGAEVAKNIILAGIKSITFLDDSQVTEEDFCSQFFVERSSLGKNRAESSLARAQQLNPMVEVAVDKDNVDAKTDDFFLNFDVVCATCCTRQQLNRISDLCHEKKIKFYAGDVFGFYGYMFADLNHHEYAEEVPKQTAAPKDTEPSESGEPAAKKAKTAEAETVTVKKELNFCCLKDALDKKWTGVNEKALKKAPATYFIMQIFLEFREKFKRDPENSTMTEDKEELAKLRLSVAENLGLPNADIIPEDFASYCIAELSPVSAVVGGVLGQEIIKAVSQKDCPHNNFFFFNGVDGSGLVDCITK